MIKVAFATTDLTHVNLHFGAAERFVIYDVAPGQAELVGVGEFIPAAMTGSLRFESLSEPPRAVTFELMEPSPEDLQKTVEDKVAAKLEFLQSCAAVYAASIGTSSIKRLVAAGIQPIIVENGRDIVALLNEVSLSLRGGVLSWVDKALAKTKTSDRFSAMADQAWEGAAAVPPAPNRALPSHADR